MQSEEEQLVFHLAVFLKDNTDFICIAEHTATTTCVYSSSPSANRVIANLFHHLFITYDLQ